MDSDFTPWLQTPPKVKISCCDCGLVHNFEFRIVRGSVQFRASRNERATSAKRRAKHYNKVRGWLRNRFSTVKEAAKYRHAIKTYS